MACAETTDAKAFKNVDFTNSMGLLRMDCAIGVTSPSGDLDLDLLEDACLVRARCRRPQDPFQVIG